MANTPKYKKATLTQRLAARDRIQAVIVDHGAGFFSYPAEHDDASIAAEVGISVNSVANVRLELFGKLRGAPTPAAPDGDPRVDELVRALVNLQRCYADLVDRHDRLVLQLSIGQITDCRHLAVNAMKAPA